MLIENGIVKHEYKDGIKYNWPAYVVLKDKSIMIFKGGLLLKHVTFKKKDIISYGRIEVNKWICYNKNGLDIDATKILRQTLSV